MSAMRVSTKKILSLFIAFVILFECEAPLFAEQRDFSFSSNSLEEAYLQDLSAVDALYLRAESGNEFEDALLSQKKAALKEVSSSQEAKNLAKLKKYGQSKYGVLWPMYVKAAGAKDISKLENALKTYLSAYYSEKVLLPYKQFEKQYNAFAEDLASQYIASPSCGADCKKDRAGIIKGIKEYYPIKKAYKEYKDYASKEIAWRTANSDKVDKYAYEVVRAYVRTIGAPVLGTETLSILLKTDFNSVPALNTSEKAEIYNYNVTRLERQKLDALSIGFFSDKSKRKTAKVLLSSVIESIISGGLVSGANDSRYGSAVKGIIQRSEKGGAFAYILSSGFASLLANKNYAVLDTLLDRYTNKDLEGSAWYEYLTFRHYTDEIKNSGGKYLGQASEFAQYTSDYAYYNAFTDIARLLAEDNSVQANNLLAKYAFKRDTQKSIKPFLAGALIYGKAGYPDKAISLANMDFGDISAVQEYDLDKALLSKYPAIKGKLNSNAVINKEREGAKRSRLKNYGYLGRAADSADILLAIWGGVSLFKMGVKGVTLAKSSYTAVKAASIADKGARIAYIKANYSKMVPYISAKRSFLRAGMRIKGLFNKGVSPRDFIKLQNDLNAKQLVALDNARKTAQSAAQTVGTPKAAARAALAESQYANKKAAVELGAKLRSEAGQSLISKYNAYRSGMPDLVPEKPFTSGELGVVKSAFDYAGSVRDLNISFANYYPYLGFFEKGRIALFNKFYSWMDGLKNALRSYRNGAYGYSSFTDVGAGWAGGERSLSLLPALSGGRVMGPSYASAGEGVLVSGVKSNTPLFMPKEIRAPFIPENATFKIAPMASGGGLGSGYYLQKGNLDLPLIFTASHVVGDANFVQVRDTYGNYAKGRVVNINRNTGYDLAAILLDDSSFLKGRVPFKLGLTAPEAGTMLMGHSYPDGGYYKTSFVKMLDNRYFHAANKYYSYMITPGSIMAGSSGGAVSLGDFDGTLVGTIMSSLDDIGNILLIPLPLMRQFFTETVKKLLFEPVLRDAYLSKLPGLQSYYSNILSRYSPAQGLDGANKGAGGAGTISFSKSIRYLSSLPSPEESLLSSSVFQVERGNKYGTGTYVNYRGFDALLTAGHVLTDNYGPVRIISPTGRTSLADIFAQSPQNGRDLAILIPRDADFLSGYKPLELSYRPPKVGMPLFSAGYQNEMFTFKEHKLLFDRFYLDSGDKPGDLNYGLGYYGLSGSTAPGNSGAPVISKEGKIFGLSNIIIPSRDLTLAVRYSVIKDFMRQSLIHKFMDPHFDFDAFTSRYPALGRNYANVIERYRDISGAQSLKAYMAHDDAALQSGGLFGEEKAFQVSGVKPMSEGWKNFRFWLGTKVFRMSPKKVITSLYEKGALPRVYIPLSYTGENYKLSSLEPYRVEIKPSDSYPAFPFTNVRAYAHRGMSLSEKEIVNIMDNGLRKVDMPDKNLAILAPQVTPGTKLQAISFSPYASVSARYATTSLDAGKGFPVMVDVTGIGPKTAHVNVHGMFTGLDIPPERIKRYNILLNIGGKERWGELTRLDEGGFSFRPYKVSVSVPANTNAELYHRQAMNVGGLRGAAATLEPDASAVRPGFDGASVAKVERVDTDGEQLRSVWRSFDKDGNVVAYVKYGTQEEVQRTLQIGAIMRENNLAAKYDLLDIDYASLLAKDLSSLSPQLQTQIKSEMKDLRTVNGRFYKYDIPFIIKPVDTEGISLATAESSDIKLLNGIPITDEEWLQVVNFYKELNGLGFFHTDIGANMYLRRTPNGKLKLSMLDYEYFGASDMYDLKTLDKELVKLGLKEKSVLPIEYPETLNPYNINTEKTVIPQKLDIGPAAEGKKVSSAAGYKLDMAHKGEYAVDFNTLEKMSNSALDKYFNEKGYYYRGMALDLSDVLKINTIGLRVQDTRPGSYAAASEAENKDIRALFFADGIERAYMYALNNLGNGSSKIPVIVKVKPFAPHNGPLSEIHGISSNADIAPSEIVEISAALNIGGRPQWGELKVEGGEIIFTPYEDLTLSSADASEAVLVSGKKDIDVQVLQDALKPVLLKVPQSTLSYANSLSGAEKAEFDAVLAKTDKLSARINEILADRKSYDNMLIWHKNELNDLSGAIIRDLKNNFDASNPAIDDLLEELYGVREALYKENRGIFKQKSLKYRDAENLDMDKFLGKPDVFVDEGTYLSSVKSFFKPGDVVVVANDEAYILEFFEKLAEDGYFGEGVIVKRYTETDPLLRDVAAGLRPKAVICDISLKGGGIFTIATLRKAGLNDIPMIGLSGYTETPERNRLLYSVGFDGYLSRIYTRVDMMTYLMTGESYTDFETQFGSFIYNFMEEKGLLSDMAQAQNSGASFGLFGPRYN